jgi:hypothetical protein
LRRLVVDLAGLPDLRRCAGMLNALALLLFVVATALALRPRPQR